MAALLRAYSVEVTVGDRRSIAVAEETLRAGTEVFIASLPRDTTDAQVLAAVRLKRAGLSPVPHIVARNIPSFAALDDLLRRLTTEGGVHSALLLAGDRDRPAGELHSSLQLIRSGMLQKHGVRRIFISAYPEAHPRVAAADLVAARTAKLAAAAECGVDVEIVSQFCFEPQPIISLAEQLRADGVDAPLRVGVAGFSDRTTLLKYALLCGIGSSVRALKGHQGLVRNVVAGGSPDVLVAEVARANAANPALRIAGVHFFTFGALDAAVRWAELHRGGGAEAALQSGTR